MVHVAHSSIRNGRWSENVGFLFQVNRTIERLQHARETWMHAMLGDVVRTKHLNGVYNRFNGDQVC